MERKGAGAAAIRAARSAVRKFQNNFYIGFSYLSFEIEASVGNLLSRLAGNLLLLINFRWPGRRATAAALKFKILADRIII
jgi:hypothetical protein